MTPNSLEEYKQKSTLKRFRKISLENYKYKSLNWKCRTEFIVIVLYGVIHYKKFELYYIFMIFRVVMADDVQDLWVMMKNTNEIIDPISNCCDKDQSSWCNYIILILYKSNLEWNIKFFLLLLKNTWSKIGKKFSHIWKSRRIIQTFKGFKNNTWYRKIWI